MKGKNVRAGNVFVTFKKSMKCVGIALPVSLENELPIIGLYVELSRGKVSSQEIEMSNSYCVQGVLGAKISKYGYGCFLFTGAFVNIAAVYMLDGKLANVSVLYF